MEEEEDLSAIALAAIARLRNLADKAKADSRSSTPRRSTSPTPFSRSDSIRQQEAAAPAEPAGPTSHPIEMPDGLSRSSSLRSISSTQSLKSLLRVRLSTCLVIKRQCSVGCWWCLQANELQNMPALPPLSRARTTPFHCVRHDRNKHNTSCCRRATGQSQGAFVGRQLTTVDAAWWALRAA